MKQPSLPADIVPATLLQPQRAQMDRINGLLVDLLGERMQIGLTIAGIKASNAVPMMQPNRVNDTLLNVRRRAEQVGLEPDYVESLFRLIIEETCRQEDQLIRQLLNQEKKL